MATFHDPDGNALQLHRRYAPVRADLLERYQALPLPTTNDEHWRFTDLRGFDPAAFTANGATSVERASGMLDVDAAAIAHVSEGGIEIERAPEGVVFEPLERRPAARHAGRDGREVRGAQRGRVEERTSRARPEGRRAREAALRPHRQLGGRRRALLAAARGRRGRQPFLLHRGVRLRDAGARRLLERGHGALRRAGREARVRLHPEPVARDVALRIASGAGRAAMPSWTGSRAASARRRARSGSRTTSRARGRPRA